MDAGLDTGPMLLWQSVPVSEETTAAQLHDTLAPLGGTLMIEALARLQRGELPDQPQPAQGMSYAKKLSKEEARLDWSRPASQLARQVRAYNPAPVAWGELDGERIRFWNARAEADAAGAEPGTVLALDTQGLHLACGEGRLCITELQRPGGKVLPAAALAQHWPVAGKCFS